MDNLTSYSLHLTTSVRSPLLLVEEYSDFLEPIDDDKDDDELTVKTDCQQRASNEMTAKGFQQGWTAG